MSSQFAESRDVVVMGVSDENMFQRKLELRQQIRNRAGNPTGIEKSGLAGRSIPKKKAVDRHSSGIAFDFPKALPAGKFVRRWKPSFGDSAEFAAVKIQKFGNGVPVNPLRRLALLFKPRQPLWKHPSRRRGSFQRNAAPQAGLAKDVSGMIFKWHGKKIPGGMAFVQSILSAVWRRS